MKLKPQGRKIYREKTKAEKCHDFLFHHVGGFLAVLILVAVFGFFGYYVGTPVVEFLEERGYLTKVEDSSDMQSNSSLTSDTQLPSEETEVLEDCHLYILAEESISTVSTLAKALEELPEDATHAVLPLKTTGGTLYYASGLGDAQSNVIAANSLADLFQTIEDAGLVPCVELHLFDDCSYATACPLASFVKDDGTLWVDATENAWISPYSSLGVSYLCSLVAEIAEAGFSFFVLDGVTLPSFSDDDANSLGLDLSEEGKKSSISLAIEQLTQTSTGVTICVILEDTTLADSLEVDAVMFRSTKCTTNTTYWYCVTESGNLDSVAVNGCYAVDLS